MFFFLIHTKRQQYQFKSINTTCFELLIMKNCFFFIKFYLSCALMNFSFTSLFYFYQTGIFIFSFVEGILIERYSDGRIKYEIVQ